ncbi:DNA polymerase delta, subunit 4-domain-containing protein [Glomus cerebriforme]|uniref:DNA polymerase delta, subunit 4-domain-containing protein n=1 Tax=Glomus cerebriforme TaxID=658196 RepID=A0A397TPM3_9GLOM|nr:DNA polymerase delta, subunit 4-domain-containing protein [Glomus cerebriforme]
MPKRKNSSSRQQKLTELFPSAKRDKAAEKDNPKKKLKQTIIEKSEREERYNEEINLVATHEDTLASVKQEDLASSHQKILDGSEKDQEVEALIYEDNAVSHETSDMESEPEELPKNRVEIQPKLTFHDEDYTPIDKLLHAFDLNYQFGPCIGLTRLERWERAHRLGLNPPEEVRDALTNPELNECVFYGRV